MKIRIITIHGIPNFGSVFQSYALCRYLQLQGYTDTQLIDYNPPYFNAKSFRAKVGKILNYKSYRTRTKKFRAFIEKNLPLTARQFSNTAQLGAYDFDADVYIAGGDQLWNVYHDCGGDDAYKLTFVSGKKISYATSMGQTDFTQAQLKTLAEKIRDFSAVSVREASSVALLKGVGVDSVQCVDPVYLLPPEEYDRFITPVRQPKYLLVYLVTPSPLLDRCIAYLSKKYNLKVILCSGFSKKCACDVFLKDLGPDEILSYIKNAEIVLSSSFHATSFSLIFQKQFFTILPDAHTNERIVDLLQSRGLSDRIITEQSQSLDSRIDYRKIMDYSQRIADSKAYLKMSLQS